MSFWVTPLRFFLYFFYFCSCCCCYEKRRRYLYCSFQYSSLTTSILYLNHCVPMGEELLHPPLQHCSARLFYISFFFSSKGLGVSLDLNIIRFCYCSYLYLPFLSFISVFERVEASVYKAKKRKKKEGLEFFCMYIWDWRVFPTFCYCSSGNSLLRERIPEVSDDRTVGVTWRAISGFGGGEKVHSLLRFLTPFSFLFLI